VRVILGIGYMTHLLQPIRKRNEVLNQSRQAGRKNCGRISYNSARKSLPKSLIVNSEKKNCRQTNVVDVRSEERWMFCADRHTHRQTHRRPWPIYISPRLRLTRNV